MGLLVAIPWQNPVDANAFILLRFFFTDFMKTLILPIFPLSLLNIFYDVRLNSKNDRFDSRLFTGRGRGCLKTKITGQTKTLAKITF